MNPEHKYRSPNRLKSMIINNVCSDQLDEFKTNLLKYMVLTNQPVLNPKFCANESAWIPLFNSLIGNLSSPQANNTIA